MIALALAALAAGASCGGEEGAVGPEGLEYATLDEAITATLLKVGQDPNGGDCQHGTAVEPDTISFGSRIGIVFQLGRCYSGGGANNLGFALSTDDGMTWRSGTIPLGSFLRGTDPSIAYDAKHGTWVFNWLGQVATDLWAINASTSTDDGLTWTGPSTVPNTEGQYTDKNWIACDNGTASGGYGNCYSMWWNPKPQFTRSTDGGLTWIPAVEMVSDLISAGIQIAIQPSGKIIAPLRKSWCITSTGGCWNPTGCARNSACYTALISTDHGTTWTRSPNGVSGKDKSVPGMRTMSMPSVETDRDGKVFVAFYDCSFRSKCGANDLVYTTTLDGVTWTAKTRVPLPQTAGGKTLSYFLPGLGVDITTGGSAALLGLVYYYYPNNQCSGSSCQLYAGFTQSTDAGATWTAASTLAGPMSLAWLADTDQGRMVGDYFSTSFSSTHLAFPAISVGKDPSGSGFAFDQAIYTVSGGIAVPGAGPALVASSGGAIIAEGTAAGSAAAAALRR